MSAKKKEPQLQEVLSRFDFDSTERLTFQNKSMASNALRAHRHAHSMTTKQAGAGIFCRLKSLFLVFVFDAPGKSLVRPVGPCDFPPTCLAATIFLVWKVNMSSLVLPRLKLVAAL